jgi:hypothetical protein
MMAFVEVPIMRVFLPCFVSYAFLPSALVCDYLLPNALLPLHRDKKKYAGRLALWGTLSCAFFFIGVSSIMAVTVGDEVMEFVVLNWTYFGADGFVPYRGRVGPIEVFVLCSFLFEAVS